MSGSGGLSSITKAIRSWNVNDAYAPNVFSDRFQNSGNVVCPARYQVDQYYRPADKYSYPSDDASACSDYNHRIDIETQLRPSLPTPVGESHSYDTLNVRRDDMYAAPQDGEYYFCSGRDPCIRLQFSTKPEKDAVYSYLQNYRSKFRSHVPQ